MSTSTTHMPGSNLESPSRIHFAPDSVGVVTHAHARRYTRSEYLKLESGFDKKKSVKPTATAAAGREKTNLGGKSRALRFGV